MMAINNSFTVPVTAGKYNNANGLPLVVIVPNNGMITVRFYSKIITSIKTTNLWELTQAVQKVKSFLLARCHENSYKVTENVTKNLSCRLFRHGRHELSDTLRNENSLAESANYILSDRYTTNAKIIKASVNKCLLLTIYYPFLFSFSRQVAITQALKLVFSFFACSSICSMSSWGKRISLRLVIFVSLAIIIINYLTLRVRTVYTIKEYKKSIDLYGRNNIYCADMFLLNPYFNDSPKYWHTKDYLTKPLTEVMIMANRYDSAPLRAEQSKVFKFYNILTAQTVQTFATSDEQARTQLNSNNLAFISRKPLSLGVYYA